jgi:hypothetical protein
MSSLCNNWSITWHNDYKIQTYSGKDTLKKLILKAVLLIRNGYTWSGSWVPNLKFFIMDLQSWFLIENFFV